MHIAQVAPLTEAIPPKLYGGTERVVSWLTEELIALGHEVTLFASGDFGDFGAARGGVAARAAARRRGARSQCAAHDDAGARLSSSRGLRFPALPPRLLSVLAAFAAADAVRHHAARPARPARAPAGVRYFQRGAGGVDLQCAAPAAAAGQLGAHRASRIADQSADAEAGRRPAISAFSAGSRRRRASTAPSASPSIAACRSRWPRKSIAPTRIITTSRLRR